MKTIEIIVKDPIGLHARPAGLLVKEARKYASTVTVHKGERAVEASRLMALMGLCIKTGEAVTVTVEGADEELAARELTAFFAENL